MPAGPLSQKLILNHGGTVSVLITISPSGSQGSSAFLIRFKMSHMEGGRVEMFDSTIDYSRSDIQGLVGGEMQTYLPKRDNVILAGCFNRELNPDAPTEIQAGNLPKVARKARLLSTQLNTVFPVFLKGRQRDRKYRFIGYYRCRDYSTSKEVLATAEAKSRRYGELSYVLYLEEVPNQK
jgi:hypothetical protein